jgi:hypothetical protein
MHSSLQFLRELLLSSKQSLRASWTGNVTADNPHSLFRRGRLNAIGQGGKNCVILIALNKISEDFWKISDGSRRDVNAWGAFLITPQGIQVFASKAISRCRVTLGLTSILEDPKRAEIGDLK